MDKNETIVNRQINIDISQKCYAVIDAEICSGINNKLHDDILNQIHEGVNNPVWFSVGADVARLVKREL